MECFKKKIVREFQERKKTLTTKVVRKSLLRKRTKASSKVPIISIVRGVGKNIKGIRRYIHGYTIKLLIKRKKSPSSPFFIFFYTTYHSFMLESQSWEQGWVVECFSCILLHIFLVWSWSICIQIHGCQFFGNEVLILW